MWIALLLVLIIGVAVFKAKSARSSQKNEPDIVQAIGDVIEEARNQEPSQAQRFMFEQANLAAKQLNESLQLANNSTNPSTKVSRLEFARSKLEALRAMTADYPAMSLTDEAKVEKTIERLSEELAAAGYYAQTDSSSRSYASTYVEQRKSESGVFGGMLFSATMQLSTPLRILEMHGQHHPLDAGPPPSVAMHEGIWIQALKGQTGLYGSMASDVGQIPADGGEYLKFLKAVRRITERSGSVAARVSDLGAELDRKEWSDFCIRLGGEGAICDSFFPAFLDTIPKLTEETVELLWEKDWTTPARLALVSDKELLETKGIGPAKLKLIRQSCEDAVEKDSELIDGVNR